MRTLRIALGVFLIVGASGALVSALVVPVTHVGDPVALVSYRLGQLLAVALFAALGFWLLRGNRPGGNNPAGRLPDE